MHRMDCERSVVCSWELESGYDESKLREALGVYGAIEKITLFPGKKSTDKATGLVVFEKSDSASGAVAGWGKDSELKVFQMHEKKADCFLEEELSGEGGLTSEEDLQTKKNEGKNVSAGEVAESESESSRGLKGDESAYKRSKRDSREKKKERKKRKNKSEKCERSKERKSRKDEHSSRSNDEEETHRKHRRDDRDRRKEDEKLRKRETREESLERRHDGEKYHRVVDKERTRDKSLERRRHDESHRRDGEDHSHRHRGYKDEEYESKSRGRYSDYYENKHRTHDDRKRRESSARDRTPSPDRNKRARNKEESESREKTHRGSSHRNRELTHKDDLRSHREDDIHSSKRRASKDRRDDDFNKRQERSRDEKRRCSSSKSLDRDAEKACRNAGEWSSWNRGFISPFGYQLGAGGFSGGEGFQFSAYGYPPPAYPHPPSWIQDDPQRCGESARSPVDKPGEEIAEQHGVKEEEPPAIHSSGQAPRCLGRKRELLSRLSVSQELAGLGVYEEYLGFMADESIKVVPRENSEVTLAGCEPDQDLILEEDSEAMEILQHRAAA